MMILKEVESRNIRINRFYLSLVGYYNSIWFSNKPSCVRTVPNFYKIIFTLENEFFYFINKVDNAFLSEKQKNKIWKKEVALNYVDYAYFDEMLFDLILHDDFRKELMKNILDVISSFNEC